MQQLPFPKPSAIAPFKEKRWLMQADRSEVSRQPFFIGRNEEYDAFRAAATSLSYGDVGGGTTIFQGAPGVGKSALMLECMAAVRQHSTLKEPWVAVSIAPGDLNSPADILAALVDATEAEMTRLSMLASDADSPRREHLLRLGKRLYDELSKRGFSLAGFSVGGQAQADQDPKMSLASLFRSATSLFADFRFVIFVDEAQNTPVEPVTKAVLDCLHRDAQGIHLLTVFFGLSDTVNVLQECGLSRLALDRVLNLEPLSLAEAAESFRRMIDAYYAGDDEEKSVWSTALADLSQGWPQHINRIGVAAGYAIRGNGGRIERHLLDQALEKGTEKKNIYYDHRIAAGYRDADLYVKLAVTAGKNPNGLLSRKELRTLSAKELRRTETSFDDFLLKSLHAGLLAPAKGPLNRYKFPIPSMGDYLRSQSAA